MDQLVNLQASRCCGRGSSSAISDCMSTVAIDGNPLSFTVKDTVMVNEQRDKPRRQNQQRRDSRHRQGPHADRYAQRCSPTAERMQYSRWCPRLSRRSCLKPCRVTACSWVFAPTGLPSLTQHRPQRLRHARRKGHLNILRIRRCGSLPAANISDCMMETAVNGQPFLQC